MRAVARVFDWPRDGLLLLVRGYRFFLSPWLGSACRFEPTCSAYALEALQRHGALTGSALAAGRLLRCHPWCAGGHDPVPAQAPRPFTRLLGTAAEPPGASSLSREKNTP
jgi:putative membrane protein insertion efficiency factor